MSDLKDVPMELLLKGKEEWEEYVHLKSEYIKKFQFELDLGKHQLAEIEAEIERRQNEKNIL